MAVTIGAATCLASIGALASSTPAQSCEGAPGTPCDDGAGCTVGDVCDGNGLCAGHLSNTREDVLDFESQARGHIVSEIHGASGFGPVLIRGTNPRLETGVNASVIYDSSCAGGCSGGDADLGTPNEDFGGPGTGEGGASDGIAPNDEALGKILIIAHDLTDADGDGLVDEPNDQANATVTHELDFSAIGAVTIEGLAVVDIDSSERAPTLDLFGVQGDLLATLTLPVTGNNGVKASDFEPVAGVTRAVLTLRGSSAVDRIRFRTTCPLADGTCEDDSDCANLDSFCSAGVCDYETRSCTSEPQNEGLECRENDDVCTLANVCTAGECVSVPLCDPVCELCNAGTCETHCGNPFRPATTGITITDALYVLRAAVGLEVCPLCVGDVNNDGRITAVDALAEERFCVHLPGELVCPAPGASTTTTAPTSTTLAQS